MAEQQQLRVVAPRFDITEEEAGLAWQGGSIARFHNELKEEYLAGIGPDWVPPTPEEWAETCAHMEWLGSVVDAQSDEANEARRHQVLSDSWVRVREDVRDLVAAGSDEETLVAARVITTRASSIAADIRGVADSSGVDERTATRLRWIANKLAHEV